MMCERNYLSIHFGGRILKNSTQANIVISETEHDVIHII